MRFLRRGPIAASPMRIGWVAPYLLYGVLLVRPLQIGGARRPASMRTLLLRLLRSTASRCRALALPRGPIAVERSYLCVTAATAVGWALEVYGEFIELMSVPSDSSSNPETVP